MRGPFITVEGCEGVGKSTQLKFLTDYLAQTNQTALFTREPGGTPMAEMIRAILLDPANKNMAPLTEAYLYASARAQHVEKLIAPALSRGELVICDRFIDSSLAYQGCARGLGIEKVLEINKYALAGIMPDITVFIDLSPAAAFRSKAKTLSMNDRFEMESAAFHEKVFEGYQKLADMFPDRIVKVTPSIDKYETAQRITDALRSRGFIK